MKTAILSLALLIGATCPAAFSQSKPLPASVAPSAKGGVFASGGVVFQSRNGRAEPLTAPLRFANGATVTPQGVVTMPNGRTLRLGTGEMLTADGEFTTTARPALPSRMASRYLDGILILGGQAYVVNAGWMVKLGRELKLSNGVIIDPRGRMRMPDGTMSQLGHGQLLTYAGRIRNPGGNPAGIAPVASYPRNPNTKTTGQSQSVLTVDMAPNRPSLPGQGTESR